jgi:gamma-glutamyltranspeptidase/glutathione hydrolase
VRRTDSGRLGRFALASLAALALLGACGTAGVHAPLPGEPAPAGSPLQPEGPSGYTAKPGWSATRFAVAAAHPLAANAGYEVLKAGGSAVDAAIAVQMVLTLVEPQSSGIGGGAFLLHFNGSEVEAFDGRETAPAAADEKLFLDAAGKAIPFYDAVVGGRSVGVPGAVRMLEMAHRQYGKLPWAGLFEPAILLAERGFEVSPRLNAAIASNAHLKNDPVAAAYFYGPDGKPRGVGYMLRNPELASVFRRIAAEGSKALHEGEIAAAIVKKVRSHATNPGRMSPADLAGYRAVKRAPLCHDHSARAKAFRICGFPPPGSGAIAIGQILGILGHAHADTLPPQHGLPTADWLHLYMEASRLAYADRAQYVGDPDFVQPPGNSWMSLLDPAYLADRAKLIGPASMKVAQAGTPRATASSYAPGAEQPEHGTSHISIFDSHGNAVAMTTTIEDEFGSRQMVSVQGGPGGFMLNNELTDFSFTPTDAQGKPIANRVQPGKRPRSSMSPTLVFDKATGQPVLSVGSPGGARIIHYTAKTLYGALHWGMSVQQAIDLPNFGSLNGPSIVEARRFPAATVDALRARGAPVHELAMTSGLHALQRTPTGLSGGADPRREGIVMGD